MPNYTFFDTNSNTYVTLTMTISERDAFVNANPHMVQQLSSVGFCDPIRLGIRKPDDTFRDILKQIKKNNTTLFSKPNINTF